MDYCRICKSTKITLKGTYHPYLDFSCTIYDCHECGCRFTGYDRNIYEKLHASVHSSYERQDDLANKVHQLFHTGSISTLRSHLCQSAKYEFILDTLDAHPGKHKVLEIGCSKGYLTAYSIAQNRNIIGMDISDTAIQRANSLFGEHFVLPGDSRIAQSAPFDAIYHVGTIGCVESPISMTHQLLSLLKPGGILFFNAPNLLVCSAFRLIWLPGTSPPDLVTLFTPQFWIDNFSSLTDVRVVQKEMSVTQKMRLSAYKISRHKIPSQKPRRLFHMSAPGDDERRWNTERHGLRRTLRKYINHNNWLRKITPWIPDEFGMYVTMIKKKQSGI